jgi:hypothetical protein
MLLRFLLPLSRNSLNVETDGVHLYQKPTNYAQPVFNVSFYHGGVIIIIDIAPAF